MLISQFLHHLQLRPARHRANRGRDVRYPRFEPLEDRFLLSFTPAVSYPTGVAPLLLETEVVTADFNNDGKLDLATANVYSQVSVLLGNGAGDFAAAQQFNAGNQTNSLAAGDLNKDGNIDLVTTEAYTGRVSILYGKGDGAFQSAVYKNTSDYPQAVAIADFNNDGNLDIVVREEDIEGSGWAQVLLGNGADVFTAAREAPGIFIGAGLTVGDVNGDAKLDIVAVGDHEARDGYVLLGGGDGTLRYWSSWLTAQHPTDVAIGDFTGDGKPDLVVSAQSVALSRGTGDGQFEYLDDGYFANGSSHAGIVTGDFNGDGKLDAVVSDLDTNTISMMLGNNDGTLHYTGAFPAGSSPTGITAGDFNRDGRLDVAVAGFNSGSNTVTVLVNDGNGPAASPTLPGDYNGNDQVDVADYVMWRKMVGAGASLLNDDTAGVGNDDYTRWRAHFGETLPHGGADSLVSAQDDDTLELSASVESVAVTQQKSPGVGPTDPLRRGGNRPGASERDIAICLVDLRLPHFFREARATLRPLHALPTTKSENKVRGNDLLLVLSAVPRGDAHGSEGGHDSRLISGATEEAVESRREALDIAFTTLECVR